MSKEMYKNRLHIIAFSVTLLILLSVLLAYAFYGDQPVIKEIIYTKEVPVSFDTMLICTTNESDTNSVSFTWFSDNGTIKGDGERIVWQAPDAPGIYKVGIKATDADGKEEISSVYVNVVPAICEVIEFNPIISLDFPIPENDFILDQWAMRPITVAEIECHVPLTGSNLYKYNWKCNGGKMTGTDIKEGKASRIGWTSPGNPGYYTVMVTISGDRGNFYTRSVYFDVINPGCGCAK
jgi:hypothetical protein